MDRRQFLATIVGYTIAHRWQPVDARQDSSPASPHHSGLPRPIVLGDGIELVDYRIYPSPDRRRIIGEIWNTRDDMVDTPIVTMTFPDVESRGGFAFAPGLLPVMGPGARNMIFGVIPDEINTEEKLATARFDVCEAVGPGDVTARYHGAEMRYEVLEDDRWPTALRIHGHLQNIANSEIQFSTVRGLVRDARGRYAGCTSTWHTGNVEPGGTRRFWLTAGEERSTAADPFVLIQDTTDYSVEIFPGLIGSVIPPTCRVPEFRG